MTNNIYWPVFKNLESEMQALFFSIHVDDDQLNVYSSKISDMVLRAASDIESLAKELYRHNGGKKTNNIKYDEDAIKHLNGLWKLESKVVIVSATNCFQSRAKKFLKPFQKNVKRTGTERMTFGWNNAYQHLKHDRANSLEYGRLEYLFDIMAALYLLNIYYRGENFKLGKDMTGSTFRTNIGSDIFSVMLHNSHSWRPDGLYNTLPNFDFCTYLLTYDAKTQKKLEEISVQNTERTFQQLLKDERVMSHVKEHGPKFLADDSAVQNIIGQSAFTNLIGPGMQNMGRAIMNAEHEAVLNKHDIPTAPMEVNEEKDIQEI